MCFKRYKKAQMQLSVQREHLSNALSKTLSIIDRRNSRTILTYCLFTVEDGSIYLEATDTEVSSRVICKAEVTENGKFCLNPRNLFDLIRDMPNRPLSLKTTQENNLLKLTSEQIDITLLICSCEDFPTLSFTGGQEALELKGKDALYFINKISHAIGHDETRIFLNGIFLQQMDHKLRAVATNGYTFALIESDKFSSSHSALTKGIIIPKKGVAEFKKLAEQDSTVNLSISIDESFMYVSLEEHQQLSIRLIAREYPPYQSVIPANTAHSMTVSRENLLNAIRRVKVLANEKSNAVKLSVNQEKLTISAHHPLLGEATEKIDVDYAGKCIDIGFNARYIIDSLSIFEDDDITFEFNNELSPVIVKSHKCQEFLGIVMPLKL